MACGCAVCRGSLLGRIRKTAYVLSGLLAAWYFYPLIHPYRPPWCSIPAEIRETRAQFIREARAFSRDYAIHGYFVTLAPLDLKELERFLVNFISLAKTREEADLRADAAITWLGGRYVGINNPDFDEGHAYDLYMLNRGFLYPIPLMRLLRVKYSIKLLLFSDEINSSENGVAIILQEIPFGYKGPYRIKTCRIY